MSHGPSRPAAPLSTVLGAVFFAVVAAVLSPSRPAFAEAAAPEAAASPSPSPIPSAKPASSSRASADWDPDVLKVQSELEETIGLRYRGWVANWIDRSLFNLTVRLSLRRRSAPPPADTAKSAQAQSPKALKIPVPRPPSKIEGLSAGLVPLDLSVGIPVSEIPPEATIGDLVDSAAASRAAEERSAPMTALLDNFAIDAIQFQLGLSERLLPETRDEVERMLRERILGEFGAQAQLESRRITPIPAEERPRDLMSWVTRLQNFLGFGVVAAVLFLVAVGAIVVFSRLSVRLAAEQRKIEIEMARSAQAPASPQLQMPATVGGSLKLEGGDLQTTTKVQFEEENVIRIVNDRLREVAGKIDQKFADAAMAQWMIGGAKGMRKAAVFLEGSFGTSLNPTIPPERKNELSAAFRELAAMPVSDKRPLVDEVYWELVALRNLGSADIEERFGYLGHIQQDALNRLLLEENPRLQAMVATHMPEAALKGFMYPLSLDGKVNLVEESLRIGVFSREDLDETNKQLRERAMTTTHAPGDVSAISALPKILETMGHSQEIVVLDRIRTRDPDLLRPLKDVYLSIYFLKDLGPDLLAAVVNGASTDELLSYVRAVPESREKILPLCSEMQRQILEDELQRPDTVPERTKDQFLSNLKLRLEAVLAERGMSLLEFNAHTQAAKSGEGGGGGAQEIPPPAEIRSDEAA